MRSNTMGHLNRSLILTLMCIISLNGCQPPPKQSPAIAPTPVFVHVSSDFQGAVTGYRCIGTPDKTVTTVQDCGGTTNVETVILSDNQDLIQQQVDPNTPDVMGTSDIIGNRNGTITVPAEFLTLVADSEQSLGQPLPWDCENCTISLGGSTFTVTTPLDIKREAFNDLNAGATTPPGTFKLRFIGCVRLVETSGVGTYANKLGFMCGNSIVSFDQNLNTVGSSNFRVALRNRLRSGV